uniref:Uncharacterized protein n=1 Tax=Rhizophora mucronata TaxID=61149 RepID=A0A2P2QJQ2_RHIMU
MIQPNIFIRTNCSAKTPIFLFHLHVVWF